MSSNRENDKIQKTVEASILDAITKIKVDENSQGQYERTKQDEVESVSFKDKTSQKLWDLAKEGKGEKISDGEKELNLSSLELKENHKTLNTKRKISGQRRTAPESLPLIKDEKSELKTLVLGNQDSQSASLSNPFELSSSVPVLNKMNLLQLKLYEGDHLKIAQNKIEELDRTIERLKIENERLASAAELFQKKAEENLILKQEIEKKLNFNEERMIEERNALRSHVENQEDNIKELKDKIEDLESRLTSDIRKSRSRERELENRLELARLEKISLVGSKDEIILDLKRQVDQLNHELGGYRRKASEMNQTLEANQEQFRRTVRALRLALTNLEVNDPLKIRNKKAE